jgi:hypothetical protein
LWADIVVSFDARGAWVEQEGGKGLTAELCIQRAAYCRQLIPTTDNERVKIMLQHIALTWERIAERLAEADRATLLKQ